MAGRKREVGDFRDHVTRTLTFEIFRYSSYPRHLATSGNEMLDASVGFTEQTNQIEGIAQWLAKYNAAYVIHKHVVAKFATTLSSPDKF